MVYSPFSLLEWVPIGPAPILRLNDSIWYVTGRIEAVAADPTNQDVLYVAGSAGGIWKTADSTLSSPSWVPLTDDMPSIDFSGYHPLMVHPSNHNLILGVVGGTGGGLLLSDDAGQTWELRGNSTFDGAKMGSIQVNQTNTEVFYISVGEGGLWAYPGVYESTDVGSSWNRLTTLPNGKVSDVIVTKFNSETLYAAVAGNAGAYTSNNGIYRSPDSGATRQLMNDLPSGSALTNGWVRLESGNTKDVIYMVLKTVDDSNNDVIKRFKITNEGNEWDELAEPSQNYEMRPWHFLLGVDPQNDNHIFVNDAYSLYESFNSGKDWDKADVIQSGIGQPPDDLGYDWVNISFDANGNALVTSDQGICRYSKSKNWTSIIGNLQVNQFYTITPDPHSHIVYGVGQDDYNALKTTGSVQWNFMNGSIGEYGKVLVDPGNSSLLYAYNPLDIDNFVRRSTDAGETWTTIISSIWRKKEDYDLSKLTQKSFVMDPSNPSRLLLGTIRVYETTNASSNNPDWTSISNTLSPSNNINKQYIRTLAIAPSDGDTIYAATNDGHLWITFNSGKQWDNYDNGLFGVADGPVLGLSINPLTSTQGFAITSRAGSNNIWRFRLMMIGTPNNWSLYPVWSNISYNFPNNLSPYSIVVDWNTQTPILYVGTDRGVYCSPNLGNTWNKFGRGLPNTVIYDLAQIAKNILIAGTHGRGAWRTKLPKIENFEFAVPWFPWMLWIPPPPEPWFVEWWKYQLSDKLRTTNARGFDASKVDAKVHLGRKPDQPISAPGEFEHMKDRNKKKKKITNK